MDEKLSIIVPVYGVEKYLRQCLDSIAAQTFKEFECILVDDGSQDACPQICDEYAAKDARFKVIHKKNAGYGAAVNTGIDLAKGEWIGIVEPDDWIAPDMYDALVSNAHKNNSDVTKCGFDTFYDDGRSSWSICFEGAVDQCYTLKELPELFRVHPSIWTCIYRRDFLLRHNIRVEESPGATWQDNLFQVQTLVLADSISYVQRKLYHYRIFENKPLRDPAMPMRRAIQIHDWINMVGYSESAPLMALLSREIIYIKMSIFDADERCLPLISKLASQVVNWHCMDVESYKQFVGFRNRCLIGLLKKAPLTASIWIKMDLVHKVGNMLRMLRLRGRGK